MRIIAVAALLIGSAAAGSLNAQGLSAFAYGGGTLTGINGAGRFGMGLDGRVAPRVSFGGELGFIEKNHNTGVLVSSNLTFHLVRRGPGWDPFLVGGFSGAHFAGKGGLYANLGAGFNYWLAPGFAFRAEFKGYAGGQDLGSFTEVRAGVTFLGRAR